MKTNTIPYHTTVTLISYILFERSRDVVRRKKEMNPQPSEQSTGGNQYNIDGHAVVRNRDRKNNINKKQITEHNPYLDLG
jgi:hypothetical protein